MMTSQKVPPEFVDLLPLDINRIPLVGPLLVDATTLSRWRNCGFRLRGWPSTGDQSRGIWPSRDRNTRTTYPR